MKQKGEPKKHDWVMLITLAVVVALLLVVFVRATESKNKCNTAIEIWYNYTYDMELDKGDNFNNYQTLCGLYCNLPFYD